MQTAGVFFDLWHREAICRIRVNTIHIGHKQLFIQDAGTNDPVNRFTEKKGLFIVRVRWPDRRTMAAGSFEPFNQSFRRVQKVPRLLEPTVSNRGCKIQCQTTCIKSKLTVFRMCVQSCHRTYLFVTTIYGYIISVKEYYHFLLCDKI